MPGWILVATWCIVLSAPPRPPRLPPSFTDFREDDRDYSFGVIDLQLMSELLASWDTVYRRRDSTSEMAHPMRWPGSPVPRACLGILRENTVRALLQVEYNTTPPLRLRGVGCAPDETAAGTLLVEAAMLSGNFTVDWASMRHQPRWYLAMKMYT